MSRYDDRGGDRGGGGGRDRGGREPNVECKVYVGDLPRDVTEKEIERAFSYYGTIRNVWVARNPPGFAFVEYEDPRDAEDSVRGLDGTTAVCGVRCRVEMSSGKSRPKPWLRRGPPPGRSYNPDDRCYECGESGHYAKDCRRRGGGGGGGGGGGRRGRSRSRSPRRRSYSRSRSRERRSRSRSPRRSRSRSRSPSRGKSTKD